MSTPDMKIVHSNICIPDWFQRERSRILTPKTTRLQKDAGKCIVYWMQRDVRVQDNWALLYAHHLAQTQKVPLHVLYCLPPPPPPSNNDDGLPPKIMYTTPMTKRYGQFLLKGVQLVHQELIKSNVPLHVLQPEDDAMGRAVCDWTRANDPMAVIVDFSPLTLYVKAVQDEAAPLLDSKKIPLIQVDAHNIVPVWHAAPKRQVGARTLRPKLHGLSKTFLKAIPHDKFQGNSHVTDKKQLPSLPEFDYDTYASFLNWDESVSPVEWAKPGTAQGKKQIKSFFQKGLPSFAELRNDPNQVQVSSKLSPWLNHGHISFQQLAYEIHHDNKNYTKRFPNGTASFIEEGWIRRELSDNYCFYTPGNYDELTAAAQWAQDTLAEHTSDERDWIFTLEELETGKSHDDLWNAAQLQLVQEGKLHGFLRMYWAKKVLEWTESPEVALRTAQYFNDKYALDGNDPNGFVGVGWSIMGIHDMGWKERDIFGKIRYMNYAGCKRKFNVAAFVNRYPGAATNAIQASKKYGKPRETGAAPKKKKSTTTNANKVGEGELVAMARRKRAAPSSKPFASKKPKGVQARITQHMKRKSKK